MELKTVFFSNHLSEIKEIMSTLYKLDINFQIEITMDNPLRMLSIYNPSLETFHKYRIIVQVEMFDEAKTAINNIKLNQTILLPNEIDDMEFKNNLEQATDKIDIIRSIFLLFCFGHISRYYLMIWKFKKPYLRIIMAIVGLIWTCLVILFIFKTYSDIGKPSYLLTLSIIQYLIITTIINLVDYAFFKEKIMQKIGFLCIASALILFLVYLFII